MENQETVTAQSSLLCPVCNNLCSAQAAACPKCGHPLSKRNQHSETVPNSQPFIVIFQIISYLCIAVAGWSTLIIVLKPLLEGYDRMHGEPAKNILYLVISIIAYAFFSFLVSQAKKK